MILVRSMHTPLQEAIAQLMFWGSMGSLPASVGLFIFAFLSHSRFVRGIAFAAGGLYLTQFLWYFVYLGIGLSTKVGVAHPPAWWQFAPVGFGIALCLLICSKFMRATLPSRS